MTDHDYRRMLSIIAQNTGDPQPPLIGAHALWTVVGHGSLPKDAALSAVQAARENGDVIRWTDADGTVRYGLTANGVDATDHQAGELLSEPDRDALEAYLAAEVSRENPSEAFVGWVNRRKAAIGGDA